MLPILLLVAAFSQINGIMGVALTVMPEQKQYCDTDAFISSAPFQGKVFLHPWKKTARQGDWYEARGYCAAHCAEIVTIRSAEENVFFLDFMRQVGMNQAVWLGEQSDEKQDFATWSNGDIGNYTNKAPAEYNEIGQSCVNAAYITSLNLWYNYLCDYTGYFIACQRPADWSICE